MTIWPFRKKPKKTALPTYYQRERELAQREREKIAAEIVIRLEAQKVQRNVITSILLGETA